jgi:hypothetical protein
MNIMVEIKNADANSARSGASRRPAQSSIFSRFYKLVFLGLEEGSVNFVLRTSVNNYL